MEMIDDLPPALLETWMRDWYFDVELDLGSSGVENYSLGDLRRLVGVDLAELDDMVFADSRTLGAPGLRQALADHLEIGSPERVVPTHGSSEAIFLVMQALLAPGQEVVAVEPCYPQLAAFAEAKGCRMVPWHLAPEDGFVPDLDRAAELIGPETRMVVVNFPHNPTGATLDRAGQERLVELCDRVGAWLVWDGAFTRVTYVGEPLPEPIHLSPRAISLGTLSKCYGLPGLRVGWVVAEPRVLERFNHLRDYTLLHLSPLVEWIAQRVVEGAERLLAPRRLQAAGNRATLARWVDAQEGRVDWVPSAGGVSSFPRLVGVPDVDLFCRRLAESRRVMLVPGRCFGHPDRVRLGFGGSPEELARGLDRLTEFMLEKEQIP